MNVIARLAPGVSIERGRDRTKALVAKVREEHPDEYKDSGINVVLQSEGGVYPPIRKAQVAMSSVIMAVVVMLLLIACVNVANLFLARARDRSREMALRLSLGARRARLIRQLLTESLVFGIIAGAAGLVVAWWAIGIANRIKLPIDIPVDADLRLSLPVLLFTLATSLVTGVIFGLAPALQATKPELLATLKGEALAGASRSRASRGLVVAQMALSLVLLCCAGLFLRNIRSATTLEKGFVSDNLLLAAVDPGLQGYDRPRTEDFYRRLTERLNARPGVRAVGLAAQVALGLSNQQRGVTVPGGHADAA